MSDAPTPPDDKASSAANKPREDIMSAVLPPPPGYDSWIEYAVRTMNTCALFHENNINRKHWPKMIERQEMRDAALSELRAYTRLTRVRWIATVLRWQAHPDANIMAKRIIEEAKSTNDV